MTIRYVPAHECFASLPAVLLGRLRAGMSVCDVGGGANPLLDRDTRTRLGLAYTVADADAAELAKAPDDVDKALVDITAQALARSFDAVVSRLLAEHVRDPAAMHRNVYAMLRPGGVAIHFFATLYCTPFVVNRLLPQRVSESLVVLLQPHRVRHGRHGKFRAYYRWCRGPTPRQLARLAGTGFELVDYTAGFGHGYYARVPLLQRVENAKAGLLVRHPVPALTSYAIVVLRRPQ